MPIGLGFPVVSRHLGHSQWCRPGHIGGTSARDLPRNTENYRDLNRRSVARLGTPGMFSETNAPDPAYRPTHPCILLTCCAADCRATQGTLGHDGKCLRLASSAGSRSWSLARSLPVARLDLWRGLTVRLGDTGLPGAEPAVPDDHVRMLLAEPKALASKGAVGAQCKLTSAQVAELEQILDAGSAGASRGPVGRAGQHHSHELQAATMVGHIPGTSRRDLPCNDENRRDFSRRSDAFTPHSSWSERRLHRTRPTG